MRAANPGWALGFLGNSPERPGTLSGLVLSKAGKPRVGPAAAGCSVRAGTRGARCLRSRCGPSGRRSREAPPRPKRRPLGAEVASSVL